MFLQSSKSIKSKILQAAIEVDQDYRRYRESRGGSSSLVDHSPTSPVSSATY
jgi:hypothetical protein